jgi:hypothetical protein
VVSQYSYRVLTVIGIKVPLPKSKKPMKMPYVAWLQLCGKPFWVYNGVTR